MAILYANVALNFNSIDLNWYVRNYYEDVLYKNVNFTSGGYTFKDIYVVRGWDGTHDLQLAFGGKGFQVGASGVTAGTVTAILQQDFGAVDAHWEIAGAKLSAVALYNAALTISNSDDISLIERALAKNDTLHLSNYDDVASGFAKDDQVFGYAGDDFLFGGLGNDKINGGDDDDVIFGELGKDELTGGSGLDVFVFDAAVSKKNVDVITDFTAGEDLLLLDASIFSALAYDGIGQDALDASEFFVGSTAQLPTHHIIFNAATGALSYDADGSGKGKAIQVATLVNMAALTHNDILVG